MSKLGMCGETMPLLRSVEMGVEILEAMDESVVARKSVEIIRHYLREFRASDAQQSSASGAEGEAEAPTPTDQGLGQSAFDIPGIARLFDDIGGLPMLDG
ncbi:uncharacterized protein PFLUO_LOCUS547 [Penicillium psychrofluorescens]|uniref:uncharacterized protein n=1 Tax=Penicillium psychrofluorescens TaxID=3158075 RepID=UPI003CCCF29B